MNGKPSNATSSILLIAVVTLAALLPFIGKAVHIDDPLFIWTARHIVKHPLDPYGFSVNWNGWETPMFVVTKNPPLASYYMALAGAALGWNEIALHIWFLLPALALGIGTWYLARNFCRRPIVAAMIAVTAPVFQLSGTSLMCDTMMATLWVWAVAFWVDGLRQNNARLLCAAALLVAACELSKYFGLCLIPLLLLFGWMERRRIGSWAAWLLVPVMVICIYQWATSRLYGRGLLLNAITYATIVRVGGDIPQKLLAGFAFTGGCMVVLAPAAPLLWKRNAWLGGLAAIGVLGLLVAGMGRVDGFPVSAANGMRWSFIAQFSIATIAGASLFALAALDWRKNRSPDSMLLLLWVAGPFLFATIVNWTVSGRNILPMLPAAAILVARRLERLENADQPTVMNRVWWPVGISLLIGLAVTWADYRAAGCARVAASSILLETGAPAEHLWFEGHWGFQYYMEQQGARPLDRDHLQLGLNDVIIVPARNSYGFPLSPEHVKPWFKRDYATLPGMAAMSADNGAGYYSDGWGPMPFLFCAPSPDEYTVFRVR